MLLETESNGADVKLAKTTMEVSIIIQIPDISFKYAINAKKIQCPIESLGSNLLRIHKIHLSKDGSEKNLHKLAARRK